VQLAVFRSGQWLIRAPDGSIVKRSFGQEGDLPIPADYLGRGSAQLAVFRPSTGQWLIADPNSLNSTLTPTVSILIGIYFGQDGDLPVLGDYLGLGWEQPMVFRPRTGHWLVGDRSGKIVADVRFGQSGDRPAPAAYPF